MEEDAPEEPAQPGIPAWVMTFADLMSLLMCFFVLLLSFSQMDLSKFKKVAGSMEKAFGVQREIVAYEVPKGTSVIAREFSPGKPQPTMLDEIRQRTVEEMRQTLEHDKIRADGRDDSQSSDANIDKFEKTGDLATDASEEAKDQENQMAEQTAQAIVETLAEEIMEGTVEIEAYGQRVVIRILEEGSFESGSDVLRSHFKPVLHKIRRVLEITTGDIQVSGHTDDLPIFTERFRSNWELSAARAVSVVHELLSTGMLAPQRMGISGYGDTRPIFPNNTKENRRHNRRIEITLVQGDRPYYEPIDNADNANTTQDMAIPSFGVMFLPKTKPVNQPTPSIQREQLLNNQDSDQTLLIPLIKPDFQQ